MSLSDKVLARIAGSLFVLTVLMGMVDSYVAGPVLRGAPTTIHEHAGAVLVGGLMRLFMSIGVVGIALAFFPVIRRTNEPVAVGYLVFRTAECVLLCLGFCSHVFLIGLSRSHAAGMLPDPGLLLALAQGALGFSRTTYQMAMVILGLGSVWLWWVVLRARLVPGWIATLGVAGYVLLWLSAVLDLAGIVDTIEGKGALLYVPGGLFELVVLPGWLWVRGFAGPAVPAPAPTRQVATGAVAIAVVVAGLLGSTAVHAAEEWRVLKKDEKAGAWVLYTRAKPGSDFVEYRIEGVVDASPAAATAAARTIMTDASYLPKGVRRTILRNGEGGIVSHSRFALPGPFSDRDVTLLIEAFHGPADSEGLRWRHAPELGPKPGSGVVRMPESSGAWEFTANDEGRALATGLMHGDLGGHVPAWMVNGLAGDSLVTDLGHIRNVAKQGGDASGAQQSATRVETAAAPVQGRGEDAGMPKAPPVAGETATAGVEERAGGDAGATGVE